ncbi:MAG: TIGR00266 family protein [Myxococcales bacterium]|nr:TIGR00266 family protein [Myxococcales bacterium]
MSQPFQHTIESRPDFAWLTVQIPAGRTLKVEAAAMAAMDTNLRMKTQLRGGFSRLLTGESIFLNEFTAEGGAGELCIAPGPPGDLEYHRLEDSVVFLSNSAFLAADPAITLETKWQGFIKGFFSGANLFLIRASGTGDLWFNTFGALVPIDVDGEYIVDTGHIVGFTAGLDYEVKSVGGYKSLFFSGEGLVCRFSGRGRVWVQTRRLQAFASWVFPFRPQKNKN